MDLLKNRSLQTHFVRPSKCFVQFVIQAGHIGPAKHSMIASHVIAFAVVKVNIGSFLIVRCTVVTALDVVQQTCG